MDLVTQLRHLQQLRDRYLAMHCATRTILRSTREDGDKAFFDVHSQFPCVTRTSQLTVTVAPLSLPPPLPAQETQASLVRPSVQFGIGPEAASAAAAAPPPPPGTDEQSGAAPSFPSSLPLPDSCQFRFSHHQEVPGAPAEFGPQSWLEFLQFQQSCPTLGSPHLCRNWDSLNKNLMGKSRGDHVWAPAGRAALTFGRVPLPFPPPPSPGCADRVLSP